MQKNDIKNNDEEYTQKIINDLFDKLVFSKECDQVKRDALKEGILFYMGKLIFKKLLENSIDVKDVQLGNKNVYNSPLTEQLIGKNEFFTPIHIDRKKL